MRARLSLLAAVTAMAAASSSSCVFPDTTVGDSCTTSRDCSSGKVCLPIDVAEPDRDLVCLPMPDVNGPVSCSVVGDPQECTKEGFPVDAVCNGDGHCACDGDAAQFKCDTATDNDGNDVVNTIDPESCKCVPAPDSGTGDAGQ